MTKAEITRRVRGIIENHKIDKCTLSNEEQEFMLKEVFTYWPDGNAEEYIAKNGGLEYMCVKLHYHEMTHSSHYAVALKLRLKDEPEVWSYTKCMKNRPVQKQSTI